MRIMIGTFLKRYFYDTWVDVLFPPLCYICDCYLSTGKKIICQKCWEEIPIFDGSLDQSLRKRSFDKLFILFEFQDTIRQLIHLLKYKRHLTLAKYFAFAAINRFNSFKDRSYDAIIPVPLHKVKKRERGYNQSEEIANAVSECIKVPVKTEQLVRIRPTSTQTRMSKEEREMNVGQAFHCPEKLKDINILLIDDVITTGSTIEACVKILKQSGANLVDILVIAHPLINE
jgi:ComF family protein